MNIFLAAAEAASDKAPAITFGDVWSAGGALMWVLAFVSVLAGAVVLYLFFAQRREVLAPRTLVSDIFVKLQAGDHTEARRLCTSRPCAFSALALAALDAVRATPAGQRPVVAPAVEMAGSHVAERLQASVDWLADIAAIAPLIGLLGTVIGMYAAFNGVNDPSIPMINRQMQLTNGISTAIVTTIFGLAITIPCLGFYAFLRRRAAKRVVGLETLAGILEKAF